MTTGLYGSMSSKDLSEVDFRSSLPGVRRMLEVEALVSSVLSVLINLDGFGGLSALASGPMPCLGDPSFLRVDIRLDCRETDRVKLAMVERPS